MDRASVTGAPSWRVRSVGLMSCDRCGAPLREARAENRGRDVAFVCPWHELPSDMRHPLEKRDR